MPAQTPSGVPYVHVTRGGRVESVHCVAACAISDAGDELLRMGDVDVPVFLRSAWKPFIAAEVVASGAAARFGFDEKELALMAASHNGEPFQVAAVRGILAKIGLGIAALQCGAHAPSYEPAAAALAAAGEAPSALHNNCSGKHAGILALCVHLGLQHAGYLGFEHPVQQRIIAFCAQVAGDDAARMPVGVDGCGIPALATPLSKAALAFARLSSLRGLDPVHAAALGAVRDAMAREPAYVGGTGRFDTALMQATRGRVVCKAGAEGVHGSAFARGPAGVGLVLKVIDGNARATPPACCRLLGEIGALEPAETAGLAAFASVEVRNVAGRAVGAIVPAVSDTFLTRSTS